jgi:hypothetical protein
VIPVTQTKFGYPDGNCMAAAVASVFELPLEDVPDLATPRWLAVLAAYLEPLGLCPLASPVPVEGWSVVCGDGPRGNLHAVVALDGAIVHDPHPDRSGLLNAHHYIAFVPCPRPPAPPGYSAGGT